MNFTKTMFALAIGSVGIMGAMSAHAAVVNNGDTLSISLNTLSLGSVGSNYFGMDTNGDGIFQTTELVRLKPTVPDNGGIVIGATTLAGPSHTGAPVGTESGSIDRAWNFFGNTGSHFNTVGITGDTTSGLNMSGWRVTWSGIPSINMGGGANAAFAWDGVYGHTYTLDYLTAVPLGDASGFGGVGYKLHLTGVVTAAVPEASTYGMMLAGLGLVGFMARRRTRA
jgi:hypothetical protein